MAGHRGVADGVAAGELSDAATVAVEELFAQPLGLDEQFDQADIGPARSSAVDDHSGSLPGPPQARPDRQGQALLNTSGKLWQDRRVETVLCKESGKPCRIDMDVDPVETDIDAGDQGM